MRLTIEHITANAKFMFSEETEKDVKGGIDNPSDAIIPYGATLYRASHVRRYNNNTRLYEINGPDAAYQSGWWSTSDDFLGTTWFGGSRDYSDAARMAYALHPAFRSDCTNFTTVLPQCDLSVWYGIGKTISAIDPKTDKLLTMPASQNVLQIYIPGFRQHFQQWARRGGTMAFGS